jgi:hypothetical protein
MSGRTPTYEELEQWEAIYREYFSAVQENWLLCDTVGIDEDQWNAHCQRLANAESACLELEERRQFG